MSDVPDIPQIEDVNIPEDFSRIVGVAQRICEKLIPLDYEAIHKELSALNIKNSISPTIQKLAQDLHQVQGIRDRLSELSVDTLKHFQTYKMVTELLVDGWQKFSRESSADKRRAEALLKMAQFIFKQTESEMLHKSVMRVFDNINSKQETISRQITCFSLMLKLNDASRMTPESDHLNKPELEAWLGPNSKVTGDDVSKYDAFTKDK